MGSPPLPAGAEPSVARERPFWSSEFNFSPLAGGVGVALVKEMGQISSSGRGRGTDATKQALGLSLH